MRTIYTKQSKIQKPYLTLIHNDLKENRLEEAIAKIKSLIKKKV